MCIRGRGDDALIGRLTYLVAEAHGVLYGTRETQPGKGIAQFFVVSFPAAVWSIRWFIAASAALTLVPWIILMFGICRLFTSDSAHERIALHSGALRDLCNA
mgnify:CR=1 FL=1